MISSISAGYIVFLAWIRSARLFDWAAQTILKLISIAILFPNLLQNEG